MNNNGAHFEGIAFGLLTRRDLVAAVRDRYQVVDIVQRAPNTFVRIHFVDRDGRIYEGCGFSKQNRYGPTADPWLSSIGSKIAIGRAIGDLVDAIERARAEHMFRPVYAMQA